MMFKELNDRFSMQTIIMRVCASVCVCVLVCVSCVCVCACVCVCVCMCVCVWRCQRCSHKHTVPRGAA